MIVTTDLVDNIGDIHPRNKLDVGNRLALWALAKDYGRDDLVYSGPLFESMTIEGETARLRFAHVGRGLESHDGQPLRSLISHLSFDLSASEVLLLEQSMPRQKADHSAS